MICLNETCIERISKFSFSFVFVFLGLGVSVDVFTLVCISIERYLAIRHPLLTMKLQSIPYSNLLSFFILLTIWSLGLLTALPNYFLYNLCFLPKIRRHKCEMSGSQYFDERAYIVALDSKVLLFFFHQNYSRRRRKHIVSS